MAGVGVGACFVGYVVLGAHLWSLDFRFRL